MKSGISADFFFRPKVVAVLQLHDVVVDVCVADEANKHINRKPLLCAFQRIYGNSRAHSIKLETYVSRETPHADSLSVTAKQ